VINFKCVGCGENLEAPASLQGSTLECPKCGITVKVPTQVANINKDDPTNVQQVQTNVQQGAFIGSISCLVLGIIFMFLPFLSFFLYIPLFLAAFVLSIVAMSQRRIVGGIVCLLLTIIVPPGIWGIRLAMLGDAIVTAFEEVEKEMDEAFEEPERFDPFAETRTTINDKQEQDNVNDRKKRQIALQNKRQKQIELQNQRQKQSYFKYVVLQNIEVGQSILDEVGVFGEVKNNGDRTLKEVEIIIYCLDKRGQPIFEKTYHPVYVSESSFSFGNEDKPLKPNYSAKFGCNLDDAPSEWVNKVQVKVINIEFAD